MNYKLYLSVLVAFVFVLNPVFAVDYNVSVAVLPKTITTKPCGIATFDIDVKNLGELEDTYTVEVSGIPETWYTLSHESITVAAGKTDKAYLFITPYCYEKEYAPRYNGSVSLIGKANATDTFTLFVVPDHVIKLTMPKNVTVCLGEEVKIIGILENTGNYTEDVTFIASGDAAAFAKLPEEVVTINPGKTSNVTIKLSPVDVALGMYTLEVEAKSTTSYARSVASTKVQVVKCYDVEVTFPKEVQACAGKSKTFEITIKNTGLKADMYTLTIEDLNYSMNVSLGPGESKVLALDFYQEAEGTYEIGFTVTSEFVKKEGTIRFVVIKCYGVDLTVEEKEFQIESGKGKLIRGKVTNIGLMSDVFKIISDVIWSSIRPEEVSLTSNESKDIYAYYSPEYGAKGVYYVNLTAKSDNSQDTEELKIEVLPKKELITTTTVEAVTTMVENVTTTVEETTIPVNVTTVPIEIPTGEAIAALWENKVFRSLLISIIIVIIILIIIYLVVMR
ncbi:MAG: hypothetical protein QMD36_01600 [Candidatus Aenigmarchaeota archaeon]|nr:hypothetical protein [Candidatus Aenigmarchaeota archaeon]